MHVKCRIHLNPLKLQHILLRKKKFGGLGATSLVSTTSILTKGVGLECMKV